MLAEAIRDRFQHPLLARIADFADPPGGDAIFDAMMAHPVLIERPFVETPRGVRLCRPQDVVHEIL